MSIAAISEDRACAKAEWYSLMMQRISLQIFLIDLSRMKGCCSWRLKRIWENSQDPNSVLSCSMAGETS